MNKRKPYFTGAGIAIGAGIAVAVKSWPIGIALGVAFELSYVFYHRRRLVRKQKSNQDS